MNSQCRTSKIDQLFLGLSALSIFAATYLIFMVVPNERTMGAVQRILYFHVGSAIATYLCAAILLLCSLQYIASRSLRADAYGEAAGEVGFLFCSIVLFSGMIWGHSAWNTWFRWEPRLVSFLLMWFVFLSLNLLRAFGDKQRLPLHAAVLGIVGACTVPLVMFSIHFLPRSEQLHPQQVVAGGLEHPSYKIALFVSMVALVLLKITLIRFRARIGMCERQIKSAN